MRPSLSASLNGLTATYTADVTGGTAPYSYSWDLGDGGTSDLGSVTHTYASSGAYNISVMVTDAEGETASATDTVTVGVAVVPPIGTCFLHLISDAEAKVRARATIARGGKATITPPGTAVVSFLDCLISRVEARLAEIRASNG